MKDKPILVFSGPAHSAEIVRSMMDEQYNVVAVAPNPDELLASFYQCEVFIDASMKVPINEADIGQAKQLKIIVAATTGATHIDQVALKKMNIPLLTLKGETEFLRGITPAAELSWGLVLACARHFRPAFDHVNNGLWERTEFPGMMLKSRTIGLIGMGRIGGWMSRYAQAFGMNVIYYDPHMTQTCENAQSVSLETLVATSDVISIHVHVDESTRGMIDAPLVKKFKLGAIFINTARSELTDEKALVASLEQGQLSSVGVDVLVHEPDPSKSPLWQYAQDHSNVIITPHIGGFCPDAVDHVVRFSCHRILDYFKS